MNFIDELTTKILDQNKQNIAKLFTSNITKYQNELKKFLESGDMDLATNILKKIKEEDDKKQSLKEIVFSLFPDGSYKIKFLSGERKRKRKFDFQKENKTILDTIKHDVGLIINNPIQPKETQQDLDKKIFDLDVPREPELKEQENEFIESEYGESCLYPNPNYVGKQEEESDYNDDSDDDEEIDYSIDIFAEEPKITETWQTDEEKKARGKK